MNQSVIIVWNVYECTHINLPVCRICGSIYCICRPAARQKRKLPIYGFVRMKGTIIIWINNYKRRYATAPVSYTHLLLGEGKYAKNAADRQMGYKYQALYSYRIGCRVPDGPLSYLDGRYFEADMGYVYKRQYYNRHFNIKGRVDCSGLG